MTSHFEPVLEVSEYHDGPRKGVAHFDGKPCAFTSRFIDVYSTDGSALDVFELIPIGAAHSREAVLAHGEFQVAPDAPATVPGELKKLVVKWTRCTEPGI